MFVLFGLCGTGTIWFSASPGAARGVAFSQLAGLLFYFGPGLLYIVCAIYLKQRQVWALTAAIVVASLHLLFLLIGIVSFVLLARRTSMPIVPLALIGGIMAVICLALAQLVFQLARSFAAMRLPPYGQEDRGFEPVAVRPVVPASDAPGAQLPPEEPASPPPGV